MTVMWCCAAAAAGTATPGMQVVFGEDGLTYSTNNNTVLSTWPVEGPKVSVPAQLNTTHPIEVLATVTNVITLRSRLNWIGESSTLLGIMSGEPWFNCSTPRAWWVACKVCSTTTVLCTQYHTVQLSYVACATCYVRLLHRARYQEYALCTW